MNTKERPMLGQRVRVLARMDKQKDDPSRVEWQRRELLDDVEGLYIGYRFKLEGRWHSGSAWDYDSATYFEPQKQIEMWLIVTNPRHNPIVALPEDVEILEPLPPTSE